MAILLTGGAGFIGSHTCMELIEKKYDVIVIDNLSNSTAESLRSIESYTGRTVKFYEGDIRDDRLTERIFSEHKIGAVMHFAGLKAVGESSKNPLEYYMNNVGGTLSLLETMKKHECRSLIFSSSATVYGDVSVMPITEDCPVGECTNPYGRTKRMIEQIFEDLCAADDAWNVTLLRYFNPIGAHPSGVIGELPNGVPNNLMPYITQVAAVKREVLNVFGDDYPTSDGTGVRDYIHVTDLAKAHLAALERLSEKNGVHVYNLGTGRGVSVLQLVHTFEDVTGVKIPYIVTERRSGDIAECYCDASKAAEELGWKTRYDINDMCRDAWNWQQHLMKCEIHER